MSNKSEASSSRAELTRTVEIHSKVKSAPKSKSSSFKQKSESEKQHENILLSQSLESITSKVQAFKASRQIKESHVQEKLTNCDRQQKNHSDLLSQRDQLNLHYGSEMKHQEAIQIKHGKLIQSLNLLGVRINSVTKKMQKTVDVWETYRKSIATYKEEVQHMYSSHQTICNVTLTSIIECHRLQLIEGKERDCLNDTEMEKELNDNQKQIEFEESKSSANLSNQKALSCDMQNQTLAENEESQNLLNNEARLIMEKEEQKYSLQHQIKILTEADNRSECDIQFANEEREKLAMKNQNEQIDILQLKERKGSLEMNLESMKTNLKNLSDTLVKKQTSISNLSQLLDEETKKNMNLNPKLDAIKLQLLNDEREINGSVTTQTEELSKISASAAEMEVSLQKELDHGRMEVDNALKEEETVQQSLIRMESQVQQIRDFYTQACQSIADLENDLVDGKKALVKLNEKQRDLNDRLETATIVTKTTEQSLTQTEAIHESQIGKLENILGCTQQEQNQMNAELKSLNLIEQELNSKIEEAVRVSAYSDAEMKECNESIIKELHKEVEAFQNKIESISTNSVKELEKLQQNLKHVVEAIENKNIELNSYKDSIKRRRSEVGDLQILYQITLEQKDKQEILMKDLASKMSEYFQKEKVLNTEVQSVALNLEQIESKTEETANAISSLEIKHQHLQAESEKATVDHRTEKQVFTRDLVRLEQTAECRRDEVKRLRKQLGVCKDNYEKIEQQLAEFNRALGLKELAAKQAQERAHEMENEIQTANRRQLNVEKALKSAEKEANHAKKKVEHLRTKIIARKAAKKEQARSNDTFQLPSQEVVPLRQITPQHLPSVSDEKENTPRSILKSSSKPSTPHKTPPTPRKIVKFADDCGYDTDSSTSTIVMVPEITERLTVNPGAMNQIVAEHRERRLAEKKIRNPQESNHDVFKIPSQDVATSKKTTPQFTSGHDKENTSCSKLPFKPAALQEHRRYSPEHDLNDSASSSSTIVMVPELTERIALNPGSIHQIVAEHRGFQLAAKSEKKKRKQQEMDNEASTYPSQDGTPSRHTTPHYTSGRDDTEITPRSILKSSNTPTPQKKTVKFVDDFDDNATSTSTIVMDTQFTDALALHPGATQQIEAEHIAAKRRKLSHWVNSTNNEISSSTPEK